MSCEQLVACETQHLWKNTTPSQLVWSIHSILFAGCITAADYIVCDICIILTSTEPELMDLAKICTTAAENYSVLHPACIITTYYNSKIHLSYHVWVNGGQQFSIQHLKSCVLHHHSCTTHGKTTAHAACIRIFCITQQEVHMLIDQFSTDSSYPFYDVMFRFKQQIWSKLIYSSVNNELFNCMHTVFAYVKCISTPVCV